MSESETFQRRKNDARYDDLVAQIRLYAKDLHGSANLMSNATSDLYHRVATYLERILDGSYDD